MAVSDAKQQVSIWDFLTHTSFWLIPLSAPLQLVPLSLPYFYTLSIPFPIVLLS